MFPKRKPGLPVQFFTTVFVFNVAPVNQARADIPANSIPIGSDNFTNDTLIGEPDQHYHLVEEIDLGQGQWSPPLWFNASLDGRGYGIHNLSLNNPHGPAALFRNISGSVFNNLRLVNFQITGRPGSALANHMEYVRVMGLRVLGGWIRGAEGVNGISFNSNSTDGQPGGSAYGIGETFHHSTLANTWINSMVTAGGGGKGGNSANYNGGDGGKGADASGLFRQAVNSTFYDNRVLSDVTSGSGGKGGLGNTETRDSSHGGKGGKGGRVSSALLESSHCHMGGLYFNGSLVSGSGGDGNLGKNAPGSDGADGGAVSGFVIKDTGSSHRDLQVAGSFSSGSGGSGYFGAYQSGLSGKGGDVFGLMAQADGISLKHIRMLARLVSGNGGDFPNNVFEVGVSGNSGGTVTSMIGQATNVTLEDIWSGGAVLAGQGSAGGKASSDRNAGASAKGGNNVLLTQIISDIQINGLLSTGMMRSGKGAIGAEGKVGSNQPSALGGNGGDTVIIWQSQGLNLTDALVAGSLISGNGGKGSPSADYLYPSGDGGNGGDIHLWGNASDTWLSRLLLTANLTVGEGGLRGNATNNNFGNNGIDGTLSLNLTGPGNQLQDFLYDTNRTGVNSFPDGYTTEVLQMLSTYTGWEGWRVITGKYPFPKRLDNLLLNLDPAEYGLDCTQYACPEAFDYCQPLPAQGSLQQVIEINHQLYGLAQKDNSGLYWTRLAQNGTVPLTAQCGVMPFYGESTYAPVTGNASAVLNDNGRIFVAWRQSAPFAKELTGESQAYIGEYQLAAGIPRKTINTSSAWLPAPVVALLSDNDHLYAVVSDAVYRITRDRLYEQTPVYHSAPGQPEQIRGAALLGETLYLLTHKQNNYTLSAIDKDSGQPVNGFTPVNLSHTTGNTYLGLVGNRLHVLFASSLMLAGHTIEWLRYGLDGGRQDSITIHLPWCSTPENLSVQTLDNQVQLLVTGSGQQGGPALWSTTFGNSGSSPGYSCMLTASSIQARETSLFHQPSTRAASLTPWPSPSRTPGGGTLTRPTEDNGKDDLSYAPAAIAAAAVVTLATVAAIVGIVAIYKYRQRQALPEKAGL